ncbi:hypothetical protein [Pseudomonas sp. C27(2019)]|uniref:hypothetical protein n=1 Tax=Pseudomonas sp. C27(2019) TaxID=2604941 RepID=UPI0015B63A46
MLQVSSFQRLQYLLRVIFNRRQQRLGWASWFTSALLPVAQGGEFNTNALGK